MGGYSFFDEVKIVFRSGKGGDGCLSFHRGPCMPRGGPDGGNGGKGGDVVLNAVSNLNTFGMFRYKKHFFAEDGQSGKGSNRYGRAGQDLIIDVPVGTQVFDESGMLLICDLGNHGDSIVLLKGGDGGYGNSHFKSSVNQAPRKTIAGFPCEERCFKLKLKLISDSGLIGFPNAGKSSFLAICSAASPKISDYPFTTLAPKLGVVRIDDNNEFTLADLPGLIEGAHAGVGLGQAFLKHVERCGALLHLVDITEDDVVDRYKVIREELRLYHKELACKQEVVALSKIDLVTDEEMREKQRVLAKHVGHDVHLLSSHTKEGMQDILRDLYAKIQNMRQKDVSECENEYIPAGAYD